MISNELMRLRKHDLASLVLKYQEERDILADKVESLKEDIESIETYEDDFMKLEEIKNLIWKLKVARERHSYGVAGQEEEMQNILEKLMMEID